MNHSFGTVSDLARLNGYKRGYFARKCKSYTTKIGRLVGAQGAPSIIVVGDVLDRAFAKMKNVGEGEEFDIYATPFHEIDNPEENDKIRFAREGFSVVAVAITLYGRQYGIFDPAIIDGGV